MFADGQMGRTISTHASDGFDHGVGHLLLLLCDTTSPSCRKNKTFKDIGHAWVGVHKGTSSFTAAVESS